MKKTDVFACLGMPQVDVGLLYLLIFWASVSSHNMFSDLQLLPSVHDVLNFDNRAKTCTLSWNSISPSDAFIKNNLCYECLTVWACEDSLCHLMNKSSI